MPEGYSKSMVHNTKINMCLGHEHKIETIKRINLVKIHLF